MITGAALRKPGALMIIVLIGSILTVTFLYRSLQYGQLNPPQELSDAQKRILDSSEALSNWLLGIAYSTLASVGALLLLRDLPVRRDSRLPFAAAACLIVSLFGRFLFYDAVLFSLGEGGFHYLLGPMGRLPLLVQFYGLTSGLVLLGIWLYPRMSSENLKLTQLSVGVLVLLAITPATAQSRTRGCVAQWEQQRGVSLGEGQKDATSILDALRNRSRLTTAVGDCEYELVVLDRLRVEAYDKDQPLTNLLNEFASRLKSQGFSSLPVFIVEIASWWRAPAGKLTVKHALKKPLEVYLNRELRGLTDVQFRLAPGKYAFEARSDGKMLHQETVTLVEGEDRVIEVLGK